METFKNCWLITFIAIISGSCATQNMVKFELHGYDTASVFRIDAPEGFKVSKYSDDHGYREYHYKYDDGSILYITDNLKTGSDFNKYKSEKYGSQIYIKITVSDSIDIGGVHEDRYWREIKNKYVVYGYMNVPPGRKEQFDNIVENKIVAE